MWLMCLGAWCAYVLDVLMCLACFACLACLHVWHACVLGVLADMHACYDEMFYFVCVCILGLLFCLICFTFQYLHLKILTAKNLSALLSWTYFSFTFWYQLIKLLETNLREAGKSIDISYRCSCSKAVSIFYNLYYIFTYYINFCWTHCFCLIYCQSSYWLLLLFNTITFLDRWMKCCSFAFACSR